jgi:hypothetical protein
MIRIRTTERRSKSTAMVERTTSAKSWTQDFWNSFVWASSAPMIRSSQNLSRSWIV